MNEFFSGKKGELTTQQIVLLIILITSFVVILFFLFRLNIGVESEREICHNSVILRGSSALPADSSPLKCSRVYVCLTEDGNCEGQIDSNVQKVKTEEDVYEALSEEMASCWWQFGAGTVDYIGEDFLLENNYCSICSQVLFDDSLRDIEGFESGLISKDKLYNYLSENEYSGGETYSEYLFGTNDINRLKQYVSENQSQDVTFGNIEIGQNQYWVVMGITSEVTGRAWKIAAGAIGGGIVGIFTGGILGGAIIGAVVVGIGGEFAGEIQPEIAAIPVEGRGVDNTFMAPTIVEVEAAQYQALNCEETITYSS